LLVRVRDGNQKPVLDGYYSASNLLFKGLPIADSFADNYTLVAQAAGYREVGFTPIRLAAGVVQHINLMLIGRAATYNFRPAVWQTLRQSHPALVRLLSRGASTDTAAQERYHDLMEQRPDTLASFFNLTAAMAQTPLSSGTPLDYLQEVVWDSSFTRSGFSAYASTKLVDEMTLGVKSGEFMRTPRMDGFGFKEKGFAEANLQLSVHPGDVRTIDGVSCIKVDVFISYTRDPGNHVLINPAPSENGPLTPQQVYLLRWTVGGSSGILEFKPPYTIE
jgi:hypothetical protein